MTKKAQLNRRPKPRMLAPRECDDVYLLQEHWIHVGKAIVSITGKYLNVECDGMTARYSREEFNTICKWWTKKQKVRK